MAEPIIGKRIRELRHSIYTQSDLAVAADVSVDVIRKLEHQQLPRVLVGELMTRGRPSSRLQALADRLHVRPGMRSR